MNWNWNGIFLLVSRFLGLLFPTILVPKMAFVSFFEVPVVAVAVAIRCTSVGIGEVAAGICVPPRSATQAFHF